VIGEGRDVHLLGIAQLRMTVSDGLLDGSMLVLTRIRWPSALTA
jgi:hypothetical protein